MPETKRLHHLHSPWKRSLYSFLLIASVLLAGTLGFHLFEGLSYTNAFYFMSMIATGQGPTQTLVTPAGKIFACAMAFISVGFVIAAIGFLFGPFFGTLWRIGHERFEEDIRLLKNQKDKKPE